MHSIGAAGASILLASFLALWLSPNALAESRAAPDEPVIGVEPPHDTPSMGARPGDIPKTVQELLAVCIAERLGKTRAYCALSINTDVAYMVQNAKTLHLCPKWPADVRPEERASFARGRVVEWLETHPDLQGKPEAEGVGLAIRAIFACP